MRGFQLVATVLLGGVVFWCVIYLAKVMSRRLGESTAGSLGGSAVGDHADTSMSKREGRNFAISLGIAVGIVVMQRLVNASGWGAIWVGGYLMIVPSTYIIGRSDGEKSSRQGMVRAVGLIAAGLACAAVTQLTL